MSKKIELNKVSAIYDEKADKVMLISKDERFKKSGFIVALDDTRESTELLRNELVKKPTDSMLMFETRTIPDRNRNLWFIPLGFNENSQEVCWNIKENNDLLITGSTASGKTTIANSIIQYLRNETPYKVKHFSSDTGFGAEENGVSLLEEANQLILERLKESKEVESLRGSEHVFYVIDELEFINLPSDYRLHLLESIVRSGKYVGVHLIVVSHSPNKIKDLGFDLRIAFNSIDFNFFAGPGPSSTSISPKSVRLSELLTNGKSEMFKPYILA